MESFPRIQRHNFIGVWGISQNFYKMRVVKILLVFLSFCRQQWLFGKNCFFLHTCDCISEIVSLFSEFYFVWTTVWTDLLPPSLSPSPPKKFCWHFASVLIDRWLFGHCFNWMASLFCCCDVHNSDTGEFYKYFSFCFVAFNMRGV